MARRCTLDTRSAIVLASAVVALLIPNVAAAQTYERLASFIPYAHGRIAKAPLVQGPDGSFYGTASQGGTHDQGTVFKIDPNGVWSTLHSFDGTDGSMPLGGLLLASDGNLYGTTNNAGGSIFRCALNGGCTTLHRFTGVADGSNPVGELIEAADGHLYGVTSLGGTASAGAIFRITLTGTFTMVQSLPGGTGPLRPMAGLIQAADGAFYGTTRLGGVNGAGTIFKMDAAGVVTTLFSFNAFDHGSQPLGRLAQTADGSFLGTTSTGGFFGQGAIFKVSLAGVRLGGSHFQNTGTGPRAPQAGLTLGPDGNYYGTSRLGGNCCISSSTFGTVFRVSAAGGLTGFRSLLSTGGSHPYASLFLAADGLLYGTSSGLVDSSSPGTVFSVDTALTIPMSTELPRTGASSPWGIALGPPGLLAGASPFGGDDNRGTLFNWDPATGLVNTYEVELPALLTHPLTRQSDGQLYGAGATVVDGGSGGWLYRVDGSGTPTTLHVFSVAEGGRPNGYTVASDGNIYGTNNGDFANGGGTLFRLDPLGNLTTLHTFTVEESKSVGPIVQGPDGNLYGAIALGGASGVGQIYRSDLSGAVTPVHTFSGPDGERPGFITRGPGSLLYGTTLIGGANGYGTIFTLDVNTGTFTTVHHFAVEGRGPSTITIAADGSLYVGAQSGTAYGTVFKFNPDWSIAWTLEGTFNDRLSSVLEGPDGNLYGSAAAGGTANAGSIFRIKLQSATTATLESSSNPATYLAGITLEASVDATSGEPTGTVEFFDGAVSLGTAPLSGGVATLPINSFDVGTHNLTAHYQGTPQFESSTSDVLIQIVDKATPNLSWNDPAAIEYGTPLSSTQLNATANVPGSFVYTPAAGTILAVGTHVLSVEFTPTDTARYTNASTTANLTVNPAPPLLVALTMPNGGDTLHQLSPYALTWAAGGGAGGISRFDVAISTNNGVSYTPIPACSALSGAARSCVWNSPGPTTTKGRIKVTATDGVGGTQFDVSDASFKIATGAATLTVSSPNSAVNWGIGSHQKIAWSHKGGTPARFHIELSRNGGASYDEVIADNVVAETATAGSYVWEVTAPATNNARVRVTAVNVASATDSSNVNFTIAAPFVTVSAPKANANWGYGSDQDVTWTTNLGPADLLAVELSTDGGTSWPTTLVADVAASLKKATVTTPALGAATNTARIRAVWTNAPVGVVLTALNPGNFKVEPPFVTVKAPNGGEVWAVGSQPTITWNSNLGKLENVRIELSTDGGNTFPIEVLATTPADGSQKVAVLAGWVTADAKIRISWTDNAAVADTSNAIFRIQ